LSLKDFVSTSLIDIVEGVKAAQTATGGKKSGVAPEVYLMSIESSEEHEGTQKNE
jgi:hypothetical protein